MGASVPIPGRFGGGGAGGRPPFLDADPLVRQAANATVTAGLDLEALTVARRYGLPDESGRLALASEIKAQVASPNRSWVAHNAAGAATLSVQIPAGRVAPGSVLRVEIAAHAGDYTVNLGGVELLASSLADRGRVTLLVARTADDAALVVWDHRGPNPAPGPEVYGTALVDEVITDLNWLVAQSLQVASVGGATLLLAEVVGDVGEAQPIVGAAAWWPLDGTGEDLIGGRTLSLEGTALGRFSWSGDRPHGASGVAAVFTGGSGAANSHRLSRPAGADTGAPWNVGSGDYTVSIWFKKAFTNGDIVFAGSTPFRLWLNSGNTYYDAGNVADPTAGVWTHIAVRRSAGTLSLWFAGAQVASGAYSTSLNAANRLTLGGEQGVGVHLHGALADLAFWPRALAGVELGALAAGGSPGA